MNTIQGAILGFILAAFLLLGGVVFLQHHKIATQDTRYEELLKSTSALQAENLSWKNAAAQQNAKIAQLAAAQAARDAKTLKADAVLAAQSERTVNFAAKLRAQKVSGDDCAGARMIESFYLGNRP